MAKVTKAITVTWKGGGPSKYPYTTSLPEGLKVKPVENRPGEYFLEELPLDLFPRNSFERHDAYYYGIRLTEEQVQEKPAHYVYQCRFVGRQVGAIGVTSEIVHFVESMKDLSNHEVELKLYDNFEHISQLQIKRVRYGVRVRADQGGYRIDEIVTPDGGFITWPELWGERQSAENYLIGKGYQKAKMANDVFYGGVE